MDELKAKFAADDLEKEQSNEQEVVNAAVIVVQLGNMESEKKSPDQVIHQPPATSPKPDPEKELKECNAAARLKAAQENEKKRIE